MAKKLSMPKIPKVAQSASKKTKSMTPAALNGKIGAGSWDQLQERGVTKDRRYQDVHTQQQIRRSNLGEVKSYKLPHIGGVLAGISSAAALWLVWGIFAWVLSSLGLGIDTGLSDAELGKQLGVPSYISKTEKPIGKTGQSVDCYRQLNANHQPVGKCADKPGSVKEPQWHKDALAKAKKDAGMSDKDSGKASLGAWMFFGKIGFFRVLITLLLGAGVYGVVYTVLRKQVDARNVMYDQVDINQHTDDQHLAVPEEVIRNFVPFPDVGAYSPEQPSSMISHIMLQSKGLKNVEQTVFADKDIYDEEGNLIYEKNEPMRNDDGSLKTVTVPIIDEEFGDALFDGSSLPKDKSLRRKFDARKIPFNPGGKDRDRYGSEATLAEHINKQWEYRDYETQRPAGAFITDVAPVNTQVLAITRAGKGQTYIEPMLDVWTRELRPNNMLVNDPKGELLCKFFVRASKRGFEVVQFNLINPLKTNIYNPLGMAAQAARAGDFRTTATIITNIAEVFFPIDGADDPVWPSAANNAFKRTAFGMIDFYLEEEAEIRGRADRENWDAGRLKTTLDAMWGKVTLFNCYQFFVQLSAKKLKDPRSKVDEDVKNGKYPEVEDENSEDYARFVEAKEKAEEESVIWDDNKELDMLTLFFNATDALPKNSMRDLVGNADKSLRSMGAAEKMLASVYGIAITAMSFFTDPTISTLTSGTPDQNFDLSCMSFPRRFGVRLSDNYVAKRKLIGAGVKWTTYSDPQFKNRLEGDDFMHTDTVGRDNWARFFMAGKLDNDVSYFKLELRSNGTNLLLDELYFKFVKGYQTNLSGQSYMKDPVNGGKIVKDGLLIELVPQTKVVNGKEQTVYVEGNKTYKDRGLNLSSLTKAEMLSSNVAAHVKSVDVDQKVALSTDVAYSERNKMVFLVTPPHLTKYAKLLLILINQMIQQNFEMSYLTKESQKPLYKTRYMLDELGNLQSEGHGIEGLETYLSIGLGQEQQFTLILQTIQQLRDVYGDSVDKIVQGNAQPLDARLATPTGWIDMGVATVGQEVLTPDGDVAVIDGVYDRGTRDVFEITRGDGVTVEACGEHLWEVVIED